MPTLVYSLLFSLLFLQFCGTSKETTRQARNSTSMGTEKNLTHNVLQGVNQYRNSRNKGSLTMDEELNRIAYLHSLNMAKGKVAFSHDGYDDRVEAVEKFVKGSYTMAENVYTTRKTSNISNVVVDGWIDSPGHHRNMLGDWKYTGIGIAKSADGEYFITQIFVGEQKP